jgi:hypothetical protein
MPLSGSQASHQFAERVVLKFAIFTEDAAIPVICLAQEIIITEVGMQSSSFTASTADVSVRQSATLQHDTEDPTATMTTVMNGGSGFQLTGAGTSIYRPNGGILVTSLYKDDQNDPPRQIIQLQALLDLDAGATSVSGSFWLKYFVRS